MNRGKAICEQLKQIRCDIARENDIPYETHECQHQGECSGNCPRCEAEVQYLEKELVRRHKLAKVAALATGLTLSMSACSPTVGDVTADTFDYEGDPVEEPLEGEVMANDPFSDSSSEDDTSVDYLQENESH